MRHEQSRQLRAGDVLLWVTGDAGRRNAILAALVNKLSTSRRSSSRAHCARIGGAGRSSRVSARLPSVSGREAVLVFTKVGFVLLKKRGKGSHMFLRREVDKRKLTVPDHDPLKPGTLRALIRHAGMTVEEFVSLL